MTKTEEEFEFLKNSAKSKKGWVTRVKDKLNADLIADPIDMDKLLVHYEEYEKRVKTYEDSFMELDAVLEGKANVPEVNKEQFRAQFDAFTEEVNAMKVRVKVALDGVANLSANQPAIVYEDKHIPKLSYDGNPLEFQQFMDSFTKVAAKRRDDGAKLSLLISFLKGEALEAMKGWDGSAQGFPKALDHFTKRFGNIEERKNALLSQLEHVDKVPHEDFGKLKSVLDRLNSRIRALEALGVSSKNYEAMLKRKILKSMPKETTTAWYLVEKEDSKLEDLLEFLEKQARAWKMTGDISAGTSGMKKLSIGKPDSSSIASSSKSSPRESKGYNRNSPSTSKVSGSCLATSSNPSECIFCQENHDSGACPIAPQLKEPTRRMIVKKLGACFKCLKRNHRASDCKEGTKCAQCCQDHHTLLHFGTRQETKSVNVKAVQRTGEQVGVLSPIASGIAYGENKAVVRMLLDSGASTSFCSMKLATELNMRFIRDVSLGITVFLSSVPQIVQAKEFECSFRSEDGSGQLNNVRVYAIPDLGIVQGRLSSNSSVVRKAQRDGLNLSDRFDDDEFVSDNVHVLLGNDLLHMVVKSQDHWNEFTWRKTIFGDVLSGGVSQSQVATARYLKLGNLEKKVAAFWEIEEVPNAVSPDEMYLQEMFKEILLKDERYEAPLLWNGSMRPTDNRFEAERHYASVKKNLMRAGKWDEYVAVLREYQEFGALELDPDPSKPGYFLPHHGVIRENSATHPLRIVFNASYKSKNGVSLNQCLDIGPNLLPSIFDCLMHFRSGEFACTGDIQKAFFTIAVRECDRKYLRIMLDDKVYRLVQSWVRFELCTCADERYCETSSET